ncbi:hypothetical protein [Planktothrix phage Pra-JY27]|nr:hypothetical protein [Planktothrix phage Pag-Yong1]WEV89219.1 KTSC domain-containing protein [Synechococcus phage MinM2]
MSEIVTGLPVEQEPKYTTDGRAIVNRDSGEAIPADEPVFILRARDRHALNTLRDYRARVVGTEHIEAVDQRIADFEGFAIRHPDRMKEPDTDLKAEAAQTGSMIRAVQPAVEPITLAEVTERLGLCQHNMADALGDLASITRALAKAPTAATGDFIAHKLGLTIASLEATLKRAENLRLRTAATKF